MTKPCKFGKLCKNPQCTFSHPTINNRYINQSINVPCIHFKKGNCMKGDRCPFKHDSPNASEPAAPVPQKLPRVTVERPKSKPEPALKDEGLEEVQDALNMQMNRRLSESFIEGVSEFFEAEDKQTEEQQNQEETQNGNPEAEEDPSIFLQGDEDEEGEEDGEEEENEEDEDDEEEGEEDENAKREMEEEEQKQVLLKPAAAAASSLGNMQIKTLEQIRAEKAKRQDANIAEIEERHAEIKKPKLDSPEQPKDEAAPVQEPIAAIEEADGQEPDVEMAEERTIEKQNDQAQVEAEKSPENQTVEQEEQPEENMEVEAPSDPVESVQASDTSSIQLPVFDFNTNDWPLIQKSILEADIISGIDETLSEADIEARKEIAEMISDPTKLTELIMRLESSLEEELQVDEEFASLTFSEKIDILYAKVK